MGGVFYRNVGQPYKLNKNITFRQGGLPSNHPAIYTHVIPRHSSFLVLSKGPEMVLRYTDFYPGFYSSTFLKPVNGSKN